MEQIKLKDLKSKSPTELLALAEENDIEKCFNNAQTGHDVCHFERTC